jgi:hypothetical protein
MEGSSDNGNARPRFDCWESVPSISIINSGMQGGSAVRVDRWLKLLGFFDEGLQGLEHLFPLAERQATGDILQPTLMGPQAIVEHAPAFRRQDDMLETPIVRVFRARGQALMYQPIEQLARSSVADAQSVSKI